MKIRLSSDQRRALIVSTGVEIANRNGLVSATPAHIAKASDIETSIGTVRAYFRTHADLWQAIVSHPSATQSVRQQAASLGISV